METTRGTINLDSRAQQRLHVLNHVLAGELTPDEPGRIRVLGAGGAEETDEALA